MIVLKITFYIIIQNLKYVIFNTFLLQKKNSIDINLN